MSLNFCIALTTALFSGLWFWTASALGLLAWAGFLGSTTYFSSPVDGIKGLVLSLTSNVSGVFWAMVIIKSSALISMNFMAVIITSVVAFFMCIQAKHKLLKFVPGTFIGACATFASDGDWRKVILSLIGGLLAGYLMRWTGVWLHTKLNITSPA
jgi:Protein of unknown function (DUF1097)